MLGTHDLWTFMVAGILLILVPGQDTTYIVGRSLALGRRAGVLSAMGITSGATIHTCFTAFGLSAVLAPPSKSFLVLKFVGAIYLAYLGIHMLIERQAGTTESAGPVRRDGDWAVYRAGMVTNLSNPKIAIFFMAFLPQFVAPTSRSHLLSLLFLGSLFVVPATAWWMALAFGSAAFGHRIHRRTSGGVVLKRMTGMVFVWLGLRLMLGR